MAIIHQAPAGRVRRRAALVTAALSIGVVLAWFDHAVSTVSPPPRPDVASPTRETAVVRPEAAADRGCDARCAVARVIVPASAACAVSIEDLAGFGMRWLDAAAAAPKFDRFAWLQAARGTVTLSGGRAEFRNAAGEYRPIEYDCDFDTATLAVLAARARPATRPGS